MRNVVIHGRDVLENVQSELLDSARIDQVLFLCAIEVEEKPMCELDLEEQSNEISFFCFRLKNKQKLEISESHAIKAEISPDLSEISS